MKKRWIAAILLTTFISGGVSVSFGIRILNYACSFIMDDLSGLDNENNG